MDKKDRPYTVVPYDPKWVEIFEKEKLIISEVFGPIALETEHVGSTSVPGMWAKPQIDIQVVVEQLENVDPLIPAMESKGYAYQKTDSESWGEKYFTRDAPTGERLVSVHVRSATDPEVTHVRTFRDYLRTHPDERELYSRAKREAFEKGVNRADYPKWKRTALKAILERSKQWRVSR